MKNPRSKCILPLAVIGAFLSNSGSISPCLAAEQSIVAGKSPSAGLINAWLRTEIPEASAWDVDGQFRVRYEVKENAGSFPNRDFLSGLDNSNDYFLFRTKAHLGWSPGSWFSAFAQGRDAHAVSDERTVTETDAFDLYQAYLRLGDPKEFPLSLKIGRQELLYGRRALHRHRRLE